MVVREKDKRYIKYLESFLTTTRLNISPFVSGSLN